MRRSLTAVPAAVLLLATTTACGDDSGSSGDGGTLSIEGVTVSGDFGEKPKVKVSGLDVTEPESDTAITGDGAELTADSSVKYRFYLATGSGTEVASNFADPEPQKFTVSDQPGPISEAITGAHIGDRIVVASPVKDVLGDQGAPQQGLKPGDDMVLVFDLVSEAEQPLAGPEGDEVEPPDGTPAVVEKDGDVVGLDFTDAPAKPPKKLQVITLVEGTGDEVAENDQLTVDYFGAVYGEKEPFDDSYSRGEPATFGLTKGGLIDGWVEGLQGVKVGSRVMLVIPSEQGYGKEGSPPKIPPNATLVFVIDVLGANL